MRSEEKRAVKNSISRLVFVGLSVLAQAIWLIELFIRLNEYSVWISLATSIIALIIVLRIYGREMNAAMKMPWIILIMAFPLLGVCVYLLCGHSGVTYGMRKFFELIDHELYGKLSQNARVMSDLRETDPGIANQCYYISQYGGYPVYDDTEVVFYGEAADGFEAQKTAIKKAEHFIFMEYHAIEDAEAFESLKRLLIEKASQGVEVRLIYDDIGSISFINTDFVKKMEEKGIQCRIFNRIVPFLNIFMNHRDHRKITVVDGKVGFTGGYNLANEYFNLTHPYGQWKDTGIRLEGSAVRNLTVMFLEMWNAIKKTDQDYTAYLPELADEAGATASGMEIEMDAGAAIDDGDQAPAGAKGYVQPFADNPLDDERVGENVYLNMIKNAKRYIYFTTPYLVISDEMKRELGMAAKRGVDVRIITPGIPDKKLVYQMTRSYYAGLVRDAVRIFEYTPGFCHAKQCVCDDEAAVVGTINLDYRSLYLHFENGAFLYHCPSIADIKKDFDALFPVCEEVTERYKGGRSTALRIGQCILRLFAPLL